VAHVLVASCCNLFQALVLSVLSSDLKQSLSFNDKMRAKP
jgi:hypothetical protein